MSLFDMNVFTDINPWMIGHSSEHSTNTSMVININRIVTLHVSLDMNELLLVILDDKKYVGVFK